MFPRNIAGDISSCEMWNVSTKGYIYYSLELKTVD